MFMHSTSARLSKHDVEPSRNARHIRWGTLFDLVEHIIEILDTMDTFVLEDLVKLLFLSIRRVLIRG